MHTMTSQTFRPYILTTAVAALLALPAIGGTNLRHSITPDTEPVIAAISGRKVRVRVPAGFREVTLQRKTAQKKQPWATVSSSTLDGGAKEVVFTMRSRVSKRYLRVFGRQAGALPHAFYTGTTNFLGEQVAAQPGGNLSLGTSSGVVTTFAGNSAGTPSIGGKDSTAPARTVTESDIWTLDGDHLYFYNQYRGLQNIDIADTAKPALLGTLRMPGVGEDLYQLDATHVLLIKRTPKELGWTSGSPSFDQIDQSGELLVCDVSTGEPTIVARVPFTGWINNSRLIGTSLIIAKTVPAAGTDNWGWQTNLEVTGYDFSTPTAPVVRNTVTLSGSGYNWASAVQASNRCFMVAEPNYDYTSGSSGGYKTNVHLVDVSTPDGTVGGGGTVTVQGSVYDKFKLHERNGVLSVVSSVNENWWANRPGRSSYTHLENFDAADLSNPTPVGSINVGDNEITRAVRFDGDRVYIVTAVQQDPLWIVDNTDPAKPTLSGELHVPGFSSYIEPLGDRLVTVGRLRTDDGQNRVTVSLYDVADATKPVQLSQLPVGTNWTYSEAEWDDKAFTVLPEAGLIMLPYSEGWWWWGSGQGGVQLVDLNRDSLALRGVIKHGFVPRRTAVKDDTVLAISQADLLTVDISDRDVPVVKADVELAWNVNRVWVAGKHLLQLGQHLSDRRPVLSVSTQENTDDTLSTLDLGDGAVQAAELKGDMLYVVQSTTAVVPDGAATIMAPYYYGNGATGPVKLSVFSIASLPQIVKLGETTATDGLSYGNMSLLFPTDTTAVIAQKNTYYGGWYGGGIVFANSGTLTLSAGSATVVRRSAVLVEAPALSATTSAVPLRAAVASSDSAQLTTSNVGGSLSVSNIVAGDGGCVRWGWGGSSMLTLHAFDITNPRSPQFLNTTKVERKANSTFSDAFAANGKVLASHFNNSYRYYYTLDDTTGEPADDNRHFLDVVDYADPAAPVVSSPISLPGELRAIDRKGELLYVVGPGYDASGHADNSQQYIHAAAFDGTAHLVDSIPLGQRWSGSTFRFDRGTAYIHHNETDTTGPLAKLVPTLDAWTLTDEGKFTLRDTLIFPSNTSYIYDWSIVGDLAFYRSGGVALGIVNIANPSQLEIVGTYGGNNWWSSPSSIIGDLTTGFWLPEGDYGVRYIAPPNR